MSELHDKTISQLLLDLDNKAFSSVELTGHYLDRIERLDPAINSYITVLREPALGARCSHGRRQAEGHSSATGRNSHCAQGHYLYPRRKNFRWLTHARQLYRTVQRDTG